MVPSPLRLVPQALARIWAIASFLGQPSQRPPPSATWTRSVVISIVLIGCSLLIYTHTYFAHLGKHGYTPFGAWTPYGQLEPHDQDMAKLIPKMWEPYLHNISDPHFHTDEGIDFEISPEAHKWKSMGKRILIVDVDTRLDRGHGALLNPAPMNQRGMKGRTAGILNHFLYALIHGYDYRLVRAPNFTDRHGTWVKVPIVKQALKTHDIVVFLDSDAIFEYMHLPFEWLMNKWNITDETLLAMAEDPKSPRNSDANGWVMWNTGFIIAQQSERTQEVFDRWENCPLGYRYPKCNDYAYTWAHEQSAFANFVRYDYNTTDDLRVLSCNEGNGMPGHHGGSLCNGVFIRHYWFGKDSTVKELYNMLSDDIVRRLHRHFHDRINDYYVDASAYTYPLSDLVI